LKGEVMKKRTRTRIISFTFLFVFFTSSVFNIVSAKNDFASKYSGTYKTDVIYIENINKAMEKFISDQISYSTEPEDLASYPAGMTFSNNHNQAIMEIEGYSIKSTSVSINGNNIRIAFEKGYYGYTDELDVIYTFDGTINEDTLKGKFKGIIEVNNTVETEGRIEMKAGGFSFDSILDAFRGDDSDENTDNTSDEEIVNKEVPVTDLLFAEIHKELKAGESYRAKATIFPSDASNKSVVYTSSNPSVARVSQIGTVTAIKGGKAEIVVKSVANPQEFDVLEVVVAPDYEDYTDEEIEKEKEGMTVFDKEVSEEENDSFTDIKEEDISEEAQDRAEETYNELESVMEENEAIEVDMEEVDRKPVIKIEETKKIEEIAEKDYKDHESFSNNVKKIIRKVKKPAKFVIGKIIDKIPKPGGLDVFHEYAKEKAGEFLDENSGQYKKTDDEIKEQLQKTFSTDNDSFVLKYLKKVVESSNKYVKYFAYPINKIFNSKQEHYKEAVYTEYKSVKDKIKKNMDAGMDKDAAVRNAKNDFVYNDNFDTTFDAIENSKPGMQRFFAMRQGGKENQVVTGSKKEYHSNEARFNKYLELFQENKEFQEES
jgi:uncharacterized protein YjdB